jgi:NADH:ubiquinone oxidoreductase subunit H
MQNIKYFELTAAQEANGSSDAYVLLTVMFASVLFFGGLAGTVHVAWLRRGLAALAIAFFCWHSLVSGDNAHLPRMKWTRQA